MSSADKVPDLIHEPLGAKSSWRSVRLSACAAKDQVVATNSRLSSCVFCATLSVLISPEVQNSVQMIDFSDSPSIKVRTFPRVDACKILGRIALTDSKRFENAKGHHGHSLWLGATMHSNLSSLPLSPGFSLIRCSRGCSVKTPAD
jgi:hypothetical protein